MIKTRSLLLLIVLLLSFTISGCAPKEVVIDRPDDSLYVGYISSGFPAVFMPWLSNQGISPTISSMIYQTLFSYDDVEDEFTPSLGESWEYVVDPTLVPEEQDYLEVRVELNKEATWSDGEPVTVEDVYFSLDLASDFSRSNHAGTLAWTGDLKHDYNSDRSGELVRQGIFTIDHPGEYTFTAEEDNVIYFHINKVLGAVTPLFTTTLILPEHEYNIINHDLKLNTTSPTAELSHLFQNPMGSGAFTLDVDNSGPGVIVLNLRDDYYIKDDDGGPLYNIESIKFINYLDEIVAINALKNGDLDVINSSINNIYVENLMSANNVHVDISSNSYVQALVLNLNVPEKYSSPEREFLKDPILREAILLAIDQEYLIDMALDGEGSMVRGGLFTETSQFVNDGITMNEHDLDKANQLLEDAGYTFNGDDKYRSKDGVTLDFKITSNPGVKTTINYIQVLMEQIGIRIEYHEGGSNATKDYFYTGNFDMTIQGIIFSMANVDMMMRAHFVTVGYSSNYGRLVDEELAAKIEEMRSTLDYNYKLELIQILQSDIDSLNYKIPVYTSNMSSAYRTDFFTGWVHVEGNIIFNTDTLQNLVRNSSE
jgi:peptide/nickel transport system substrate-binding protein